ncbi:hypothetical protein G9463_23440 [Haloarcula sp. JP-Z28]|uniref:hypothetical protein n=1 Tax=Haloarcula sp. JP-Z28 TaxID=2716715 RepID=UPI00140456BF|nr:hypothetical protein [Haloarcula sp. JP-Z28]NHN66158.1 hypothetical protein [Haloarcula sp. JP-Z28]
MSGQEPYTNSYLFNERYLQEELRRRPEWNCDEKARESLSELHSLFEEEYETVQNYEDDEGDTIDDWIQPALVNHWTASASTVRTRKMKRETADDSCLRSPASQATSFS